MPSLYGENAGDLVGVLREVVARMQTLSGADIIALYPFDSATETFYAPVAIGISDEGLLQSLPDMADQLRRYHQDLEQGKAPEELLPTQYGPNVWLSVMRRPLLAGDTPRQLDSSFIRRNKIRSVVGLPLLAGEELVALLFLDYVAKNSQPGFPDESRLAELEAEAARAAIAIEQARKADDLAAFRATIELVGQLSAIVPDTEAGSGASFRGQIERTLASVLKATGTDAAAVYAVDGQGRRLDLVAVQGITAAFAASVAMPRGAESIDLAADAAYREQLQGAELFELAVLPLRAHDRMLGALVVAGRDALALTRKPSAVHLLLRAAADLIAGALENHHLVDAMEETNRTFSALSALGKALLRPGASQAHVLEAVVSQLTDPAIPEFDFQFATIYMLGVTVHGELSVRQSAGATGEEAIDSVPASQVTAGDGTSVGANGHRSPRIPRWVLQGERRIDSKDVLSFVARQQRTVIIASLADGREHDFVVGYPDGQLDRLMVPVARGAGEPTETVRAVVLRAAAGNMPGGENGSGTRPAAPLRDFQLQGDLFDASGHADLIRVFVPFGSDSSMGGLATGVLEAGYHISKKRQIDRLQIEALNAAAAQIAVAVETARLYEDAEKRAEQLEIVAEVSRAIASTIDLEQTLRHVARNMLRVVDTSICLIALFEDDGSAWYGAAASADEELWRRQRVERPEPSILFDVADRGRPIVVEDAPTHDQVRSHLIRLFGIRSVLALPLLAADGP
ncbi:MAG: hypothetical protein JWO42_426, partial [Chloroflexi bacterium]|nr:hypothetical protein [Chloroflexota bacterium]